MVEEEEAAAVCVGFVVVGVVVGVGRVGVDAFPSPLVFFFCGCAGAGGWSNGEEGVSGTLFDEKALWAGVPYAYEPSHFFPYCTMSRRIERRARRWIQTQIIIP